LNVSVFDTADNVLGTNKVSQKSENFPMSAKSVVMPNISRAVIGTYQAKQSSSFTQIRKNIYITKIASGTHSQN
jgi:hypothetical protein